ncbi:hypothetical protein [uncultured Lacinutrix sp.]|uniref:hypothetical protein n=1 Tax=uncultured Lacinutrix sp. TaxID=574032 RepID=UPI00260E4AC8|nr:hypothetical protein [uncultured Lacinutrix sp.]
MFLFKNILKGNYLQYVRSYSFLITIALSLYIAFSFIPAPDANYTTIRFGEFTGNYNSVWIGFVTAIMSSAFLSLFGFFLINGSIRKDIETRIGHIIGTTQISNTSYILAKMLSNFFILFTILVIVFIVSLAIFFLYSDGYSLQLLDFIIPYFIIAVPSLLFTSSFSLLLEILIPKKRLLQYGAFLFIYFFALFASSSKKENTIDVFGIQYPTAIVSEQIQQKHLDSNTELAIGFISGGRDINKTVAINTISFPNNYLFQRFFWVIGSFLIVYLVSFFFHRFNIKEEHIKRTNVLETTSEKSAGFQLGTLIETPEFSTKLTPLIFTELLMLVRKREKWLWLITLCGMIASFFVPIIYAHYYILPLLWFLQVTTWSNLVTKDLEYRTHYFAAASYKPLHRLFISRVIAGISIALFITIPLLIRYLLELDFITIINIIFGAIFIVLLAVFLGTLTKSKKLFEIVFFFLIYSNINLIAITDYFGAVNTSLTYTGIMLLLILVLFTGSYFLKKLSYE